MTRVTVATEKFLKVPLADVRNNVGNGIIVNQIIRTLIKPELQKRGMEKFRSAIIELSPKKGQSPRFHLDNDCMFTIKFNKNIAKPEMEGKYLFKDCGVSMDDVDDLSIPEDFGDPNSAKAFVVRFDPYFFLYFDFRYNRSRVRAQLERAKEYVAAARKLDPKSDHAPLCDMLWSAMELIAQATILSLPTSKKTKAHDKLKRLDKIRKSMNVISEDFMKIFEDLTHKRPAARYPDSSKAISWQEKIKPLTPKDIQNALDKIERELKSNVLLKV